MSPTKPETTPTDPMEECSDGLCFSRKACQHDPCRAGSHDDGTMRTAERVGKSALMALCASIWWMPVALIFAALGVPFPGWFTTAIPLSGLASVASGAMLIVATWRVLS